MSIQRVDPRFALPRPIRRAVVLGALGAWVEGLREAGIEASESVTADAPPDLVVAPVGLASQAVSTGAEMIIVEGRGGERPLRRAGFDAFRLIPISSITAPRQLVRPDHPHAAVYGVEHGAIPTTRARSARNSVAKALLARRWFPDLIPAFTVGLRSKEPPFLLAEAEAFGVPRDGEWFLTLGGYDAFSRNAFHVFAAGRRSPGWVVKFARVPNHAEPFEQDERGFRLASAAGQAVGEHVPRILGRMEVGGLHASVEVAADGYILTDFLRRSIPRSEKTDVIELIATWILSFGANTSSGADTLRPERERLAGDLVPRWADYGVTRSLVDDLPDVTSVSQHGNIGAWNVITRGGGEFSVIDWECAREGGLPLWDLLIFLSDALSKLDGATGADARAAYLVRLFRGEEPSSLLLFRWVRRVVESLHVPGEAVGAIATLCWMEQGAEEASRRAEHARPDDVGAREEGHSERFARLWLTEPGLGPAWNAWI